MSLPQTGFYLILGAAIRGLYDLDEDPASIQIACETALHACMSPDPLVDEAAERFVKALRDQLAGKP